MKSKKKEKLLPFDKRNEDDYQKITEKIEFALQKIERDGRIPATQEKLAELAECSRKTLNNRKYPIERLRQIKNDRKQKSLKIDNKEKISAKSTLDNSDNLNAMIKNYQKENGLLFNRLQDIEEQNKSLKLLVKFYEDEIKDRGAVDVSLPSKLWKFKDSSQTPSNVTNINRNK